MSVPHRIWPRRPIRRRVGCRSRVCGILPVPSAPGLRYWVITSGVEGVAAQEPTQREVGASPRSVFDHCLCGVLATRRQITARRSAPRTDGDLIAADERRQQPSGEPRTAAAHLSHATPRQPAGTATADELSAASRTAPPAASGSDPPGERRPTQVGLGRRAACLPAAREAFSARAERTRRFTELRATAPPTLRPATTAARAGAPASAVDATMIRSPPRRARRPLRATVR